MDVKQFDTHICVPTLKEFSVEIPFSETAHLLVLETMYHESGHLDKILQVPNGPAMGLLQMEPSTFDWLVADFLPRHPKIWEKFKVISPYFPNILPWELFWNLRLCVAMCRVRYYAVPAALPAYTIPPHTRADYWFKFYNASGVPSRKNKYISDALHLQSILF
jgi:hypothetical protein